jgi:acetyl esterase/lipase
VFINQSRRSLSGALMAGACVRIPAESPAHEPVEWAAIAALPLPAADHRAAYGPDPLQFGELRLPDGPGPHPVAVIIHGGCWRSEYDLRHITHAGSALTRAGVATWIPEFRRIGDAGGGWPGTFADVAAGTEHLRELAAAFPLDLDRVVLVGHSAGGHLALWLAARRNLPPESALHAADPLPVRGVVALAGISELAGYGTGAGNCNAAVAELLGGTPAEFPARYAEADPVGLLPLGVPVRLLHGTLDPIVPPVQSERFAERARTSGDDARAWMLEGAGHFDVIAPSAPAWASVERAVRDLLAGP